LEVDTSQADCAVSPPGAETTPDPAVGIASMPWVFTQRQPLGTADFIKEAARRGVKLRPPILRVLYRAKVLEPFLYVNNRQVGPVPLAVGEEPRRGGTLLHLLRYARDRGRLSDPATLPYRPRLRFDDRKIDDPPHWWNGLLYSWYQLLICPELDVVLRHLKGWRTSRGSVVLRLPDPGKLLLDRAAKLRTIAIALAALEARYLPTLDQERLHLSNADFEEWQGYRDGFDPVALSAQLGYSAEQARQDGEWLLMRAHSLDPVGDSWSQLMRRAPATAWKGLKDGALSALDYRIAAEILLLFYEDLVDRGQAEPLPDLADMRMGWHPLHERLSSRRQTLDEDLVDLGISPHPRVILAVEGETEQTHVPLIWKELDYPDAPELMRLLMLGGVARNLEKVAALAAAPLVGPKIHGARPAWSLIKPPTCLYVAADPEGQFAAGRLSGTQTAMRNEIKAVLKAQGVAAANPTELDELVRIHTWAESCYEFAHFTDDELADGIMTVHDGINGWTKDQLVRALSHWRDKRKDIKRVWESGGWDEQRQTVTGRWDYEVSKTKLADALWPTLKAKIDRCRTDAEARVPEIVEVVEDVYHIAQRWRYLSFALSEDPDSAAAPE
jgi:hypothetical protein